MDTLFPIATPFPMEADEHAEDLTEFREWNNRLRRNLAPTLGQASRPGSTRLYEVVYFDHQESLDLCLYVRAHSTPQAKQLAISYYFPGDMLNDPTHAQTAARMKAGGSVTAIKIYDSDELVEIGPIPWREVWRQMAGRL